MQLRKDSKSDGQQAGYQKRIGFILVLQIITVAFLLSLADCEIFYACEYENAN